MSTGGSGSTGWLSWLNTTWTSMFGLGLLPGWTLFASMLASWSAGASAVTFWNVIGLHVACWIEGYTCWMVAQVLGTVLPRLLPAVQALPAMPTLAGTWWVQGFLLLDYLVPVHEMLLGLGSVAVFVVAFRLFRFIKQFVVTASN